MLTKVPRKDGLDLALPCWLELATPHAASATGRHSHILNVGSYLIVVIRAALAGKKVAIF